ncbi:hypothetical protein Pelo_12048 [Pelomyxa schiedti]|nr:hypothetical protein Pelo_12048 [Pelomyxa schiedti]
MPRLSKGLLNASSLMTLILSGCPIGDTCFSILLPSLRSLVRNRFLRIIDLTDCQLTDKSASSISQVF